MTDGPNEGYAFVIDTNSYAGNFEREMTAYLTGVVGECGVGEELIEKLPIDFEDNVQQVADEHGCYRPTTCWMEPKAKQNNSVAIFFYKKPTTEEIEFMKERVKDFDHVHKTRGRMAEFSKNDPVIEILGFRLIKFNHSTNEEEV